MSEIPVSIWRTTDGLSDTVYTGLNFIVDTMGNFLVDPEGNFIIDTGLEMPGTPASIWEEDNSI